MKNAEQIKLIIFGVSFFIFCVILVFTIRKFVINSFHRKCRALRLSPAPADSYYCLGSWKDARVAVERCGTKYCNTIYVYMDLGNLPEQAARNLGFYMQGLQTDYLKIEEFGRNKEFDRIVSGTWRGFYFKSDHLKLNATDFHIRQLFEAMYSIRTELRRRAGVR